jgi:hypothetical protein
MVEEYSDVELNSLHQVVIRVTLDELVLMVVEIGDVV